MKRMRRGIILALIVIGATFLQGGDCEFELDLDRGGYWWGGPAYIVEDVYYDPWYPCCWW